MPDAGTPAAGTPGPTLSVIVPTYNVEAYLRQCLMSVLEQPNVDLEVIVVNDCATDRSRAIAGEVAALDSRVRIIDNPVNMGLGPSRNAGMAVARGRYVMFLDSDDFVMPGTLESLMLAALEHEPEIVFYDYERVFWDDSRQRNIRHALLSKAPRPVSLADRPALLTVLNVAWNKLYRRDFLEATRLQFPVGYYEDIPFTYPILAIANSILLVDEVVVGYRQRRSGSILRSHNTRHGEIVDQVERLFAVLDEHPEASPFANDIFVRAVNHVLTVVDGDRLPAKAKAEVFQRGSEVLNRVKPAGFTTPPGAEGVKIDMVLRGRYGAYEAFRRGNSAVRSTKKVAKRARKTVSRRRVRTALNRAEYSLHTMRGIDENLTVFFSLWGRPPTGNPMAIEQELRRVRPEMRSVWLMRPRDARKAPTGVEAVPIDSAAAQSVLARARYLVSDVNFPDHVERRKGQVMLQTQHGTPLKFMGLDMQRFEIPSSKMNFEKLMNRVDVWSYNLSSNSYSSEVWRRAFPARYTMLEYGYPRNDRLVNATAADSAAARELLGIPDHHFVVLYAPTHRDYRNGFAPDIDAEGLLRRLPENTTILMRGHYFYADKAENALGSTQRVIDVGAHPLIEDLYLAADVLISDYSSAMFDYANLNRPIVVHAPDWDRYRATRGAYFDIVAEAPGHVTRTVEELAAALQGHLDGGAGPHDRLHVFRQRFCEFEDGHAAERVVAKLFLGDDVAAPGSVHGTPPPLHTWVTDRAG